MSYGIIKVDTVTFTDSGVDKNISLSGLVKNPTFTGNVTATGTISGDIIRGGTTVSGATVTGTTANFASGVFTTQLSGTTILAATGTFQHLTGVNTLFTTLSGVSGVFTTQVSGLTAIATTGTFTSLTGTTATFTSGIIASGTAALPSLAILSDPNTGLFSPGADQIAISTNGVERFTVNSSGNFITTGNFVEPFITGTIVEDIFTITDAAAFEVDPSNGSIQLITLGASRTPKCTNFIAGESITLMVNDGTAYTITWTDATWGSGGVIWKGGSAPTLATTGDTVIQFWKVSTQVYGAYVGDVA